MTRRRKPPAQETARTIRSPADVEALVNAIALRDLEAKHQAGETLARDEVDKLIAIAKAANARLTPSGRPAERHPPFVALDAWLRTFPNTPSKADIGAIADRWKLKDETVREIVRDYRANCEATLSAPPAWELFEKLIERERQAFIERANVKRSSKVR